MTADHRNPLPVGVSSTSGTAHWTERLAEHARATRVQGATLGLWVDGQQHLAATGVLSTATGVPVTTDSLFQIGSITKPWTATMIMQLIDEGKLSLDTTVAQVLPGLRLGVADTADQVTNASEGFELCRRVFSEIFEQYSGVRVPDEPGPAAGVVLAESDLSRHAGRYERESRRMDFSVRDGRLHMATLTTGQLAESLDAEGEELFLYPADASGDNFVCRSFEDQPWQAISFGKLDDGTPYCYGGRVTLKVS